MNLSLEGEWVTRLGGGSLQRAFLSGCWWQWWFCLRSVSQEMFTHISSPKKVKPGTTEIYPLPLAQAAVFNFSWPFLSGDPWAEHRKQMYLPPSDPFSSEVGSCDLVTVNHGTNDLQYKGTSNQTDSIAQVFKDQMLKDMVSGECMQMLLIRCRRKCFTGQEAKVQAKKMKGWLVKHKISHTPGWIHLLKFQSSNYFAPTLPTEGQAPKYVLCLH